jgi:predicted alpha-1,6-mannanase (GH76 family)
MAFEIAGWQGNVHQACPGGIPFENEVAATERNTVANAPTAGLAVQLYRITGDRAQLDFATLAYEWVRRCLLLPSGLYADSIRPRGQIDPTVWSYNQGSMIGAGTLLYRATGDPGLRRIEKRSEPAGVVAVLDIAGQVAQERVEMLLGSLGVGCSGVGRGPSLARQMIAPRAVRRPESRTCTGPRHLAPRTPCSSRQKA